MKLHARPVADKRSKLKSDEAKARRMSVPSVLLLLLVAFAGALLRTRSGAWHAFKWAPDEDDVGQMGPPSRQITIIK